MKKPHVDHVTCSIVQHVVAMSLEVYIRPDKGWPLKLLGVDDPGSRTRLPDWYNDIGRAYCVEAGE